MAFLLTFSGGGSATYKDAVRAASTASVPLTGSTPLVIDGVTLADKERVLLKDQSPASGNGIYEVAISGGSYTLSRAKDADTDKEVLPGMLVPIAEGTLYADKIYQLLTNAPIVVGVTSLVFSDVLIGLANKADRDLANLLPTSINQSLLFADDTSYNIGAAAASRPQTLYVKTAINLNTLVENKILASDGSKNIVSLDTATYPSLSELAFLKGTTSNVQTQFSQKANVGLNNLSAPTAINQNLTFAKSAASLEADNTQTTIANATLVIKAGDGIASNRGNLNLYVRSNNTALGSPNPVCGLNIDPNISPVVGDGASDFNFSSGSGRFFRLRVDAGNVSSRADMWQGGQKFFTIDHNGTNISQLQLLTSNTARLTISSTGVITIANQVRLSGSSSGYVELSAPASPVSYSLTLPSAQGAASSYLQNNGSGTLSWATIPDPFPVSVAGDVDKVLTVDAAGVKSWQYAGRGTGFSGQNVILGRSQPVNLTTASANILAGVYAGEELTTGANNTLLGWASCYVSGYAYLTTGSGNTLLGSVTSTSQVSTVNSVAIGYKAIGSTNSISVGYEAGKALTTGSLNVLLGYTAGDAITTGSNNTVIGDLAGSSALSDTTLIGAGTTQHIKIEPENVTIGTIASTSSTETVSIGYNASVTGQGGTALGRSATAGLVGTSLGRYTESGTEALAVGHNAKAVANYATAVGGQSLANGAYSTAVGGAARTGTGLNNVSVGVYSGFGTTTGQDNLFLGYGSGQSVTTGSGNTILGQIAGSATLANTVIVAAGATERFRVDSSGNMGVGTTSPATKLDVNGGFKFAGGLIVKSSHAQVGTANVITMVDSDFYLGVDCSGAAKGVTLPAVAAGKKVVIKDESGNAATNNITVTPASGTVDGAANYVMAVNYEALTIVSDGTNWFII